MLHKLRLVMGKRDSEYSLQDVIELGEGFFSTETDNILESNASTD
jgi:hypothetical protein